MNSSHHTYSNDIHEMPVSMGSDFASIMSAPGVYKHHEAYSDERSPTLLEEPSSPKSINRPCLLQKGVIEKCYKSRFYSRAVEFYLLENDPTSFKNCRCLMENCPQRSFTDARYMLLHLKDCKYFSQGIYRCPTCNDAEKFQTTSNKKCSWDRPNMRQRLQNTFKATVDTVKGIVSPRSISRIPFRHCKECGQTVAHKEDPSQWPGVGGSRCSTSPIFDPDEIRIPLEMNDTQVRGELMADTPLVELQAASLPLDHRDAALDHFNHGEVSDYSCIVSNCSSSSPNPLIELSSVSPSMTRSADVSPTTSAESSLSASRNDSEHQCLPADSQFIEFRERALNTEAIPNTGNHMNQAYNTWQPSSLTQLYNAPPSHLSMPPIPRDQRGFRESRGYSLTIQTNHLEPALNPPLWGGVVCHNASNPEAMNIVDSSALGNMPPPMSSTGIPSFSNIDVSTGIGRRDALLNVTLSDSLFSPDSAIPSSSTEQSPSSALSDLSNESHQCPHCDYRPTGKKENARAYLNKHMSTHGSPSYKCEYCERVYSRPDNRGVHVRKHHRSQDDCRKRRKESDSSESEDHRRKRVLYDESGQEYF
ncbi:hypothetical protein F5Y00DRAFT_270993 [Daldinia vernicosa]|uniref:uncharacterized protein n=1 Tax=Daldinia vernicosa TaxID=114800 RepID=UPI002008DE9D|nr:uncharacterized protein F5Y00DRAFT_270993 [Daldinia vernicosa]KAI0847643.1 hypothetical protein F5Y00DRAFT_270993 [Daldinia vernicosa]